MSLVTIYSPNKSYTGLTASILFAGGRSHPVETEGNEGLISWFEKRKFIIEELTGGVEPETPVVASVSQANLPPVEEEGEDELDGADYDSGTNDPMDAEPEQGTIDSNPKRTSKPRIKKSKK